MSDETRRCTTKNCRCVLDEDAPESDDYCSSKCAVGLGCECDGCNCGPRARAAWRPR